MTSNRKNYFIVPGYENINYRELKTDIKMAKERIILVTPHFTHPDLFHAISENTKAKRYFLTHSYYNYKAIIKTIEEKNNQLKNFLNYNMLVLQESANEKTGISRIWIDVLLSPFGKTLMHPKFIVCDNVVWFGSWNFTYAGQYDNCENVTRIEDKQESDNWVNFYNNIKNFANNNSRLYELTNNFFCASCKQLKDSSKDNYIVSDQDTIVCTEPMCKGYRIHHASKVSLEYILNCSVPMNNT